MFSLHIERCTFLGIDMSFLLELSAGAVVCDPLFTVMHHCMFAHCSAVPFVLLSLFVY